MIALMPFFGVTPGASLLLLPLMMLLAAIFTTGVGLWFAALNAEYRDLGTALPVLIQLWMFASPVIYPSSLVPPGWRTLYSLNPLAGIVEGTRASLFGLSFDWFGIAVSALVSVLVLVASVRSFCHRGEGLVESL
jgi:lipopolysaccharide transport system permease protein